MSADWRSLKAYAYVADLDPAGIAWEFLRRNPAFHADCVRAASAADPLGPNDLDALSARWGVRFPG